MKKIIYSLVMSLLVTSVGVANAFYQLESSAIIKTKSPDWDYVTLDTIRGRLYIGMRADGIGVFDIKTNKFIKAIENSKDANSILLIPEFNRGYSFNGDGTSTIFDLSTMNFIDRISYGSDADAGFYDPVTKQIAITMGDSHKVTFIDAKSLKVTGTLNIDSSKLDGTVADNQGNFYMALRDKNTIIKFNASSKEITHTWKTAACNEPTGLAIDHDNQRLFIGCRSANPVMAVMNSENGQLIGTFDIGRGNDGVIYDSNSKRVITSNGVDANIVIYTQKSPDNYVLEEAITTRPYARTMSMNPTTKKIYTVTAEGVANPAKKINKKVSTFYPNEYYENTFTVLTYSNK